MSPLQQSKLLLPLLTIVRDLLTVGESASFHRTTAGSPYIQAQTERDVVIFYVEDGLLVGEYTEPLAASPDAHPDAVANMVRRQLNEARRA